MKTVKWTLMMPLCVCMALLASVFSAPAETVYTVGAILPKTGYGATLGRAGINGINLALKEYAAVKGGKLKVIIYDSEGKEASAVLAAKRLIEKDKVLAIIGPIMTGAGAALIPTIEKAKVPMIFCGGGTMITEPVELRRYSFRLSFSHRQAPMRLLGHLQRSGTSKLGILYVNNAFGRDGMEELSKWASKFGVKVVAKESVEQGDVDVTAQLTKIRDSGAEVMAVWVVGTPAVITYKNYRQMGIKIPLIGNHGLADSLFRDKVKKEIIGTHLVAIRTFAPEGLPDSYPAKKFLVGFKQKYIKAYGYVPGTFDSDMYDGVRLVAAAINAGAKTPADICHFLEKKVHGWEGTTGTYYMSPNDHGGLYSGQMVIVTAKPGQNNWALYEYKK